jgi:hypothetical protein
MILRLLNRVLGLVGVRLERTPKDRFDAMLAGRKMPVEKRDWN